jgi:HK97 gp10 family phage protein
MDLNIKVDGLDNIGKASQAMQKAVIQELNKGLVASAAKVHDEASKSLTGGKKTGKIYKRGNKTHQSSAAGEAPASDTGTLVQSLSFYNFKEKLEATVVSRLEYAKMLEFGTSKIAPRPFLFPAYEKSKEWIKERLDKAVRNAAIKSTRK